MVLEKTLESPLGYKEIQPAHCKGNQSWIFIGRTDAEAETPILWPPHAKNWLTGKRPWCWERLKAGEEGDDRGWDGWMASPTQWTWVCLGRKVMTNLDQIRSDQISRSVVSDSLRPHGVQASLFITNSRSWLKRMSTELVMPSNHLILCRPLLLPPSIFPMRFWTLPIWKK